MRPSPPGDGLCDNTIGLEQGVHSCAFIQSCQKNNKKFIGEDDNDDFDFSAGQNERYGGQIVETIHQKQKRLHVGPGVIEQNQRDVEIQNKNRLFCLEAQSSSQEFLVVDLRTRGDGRGRFPTRLVKNQGSLRKPSLVGNLSRIGKNKTRSSNDDVGGSGLEVGELVANVHGDNFLST